MIGGTCAACGLPGHRYGATDGPRRRYSATACINSLRSALEELDLAYRLIWDTIPADTEAIGRFPRPAPLTQAERIKASTSDEARP